MLFSDGPKSSRFSFITARSVNFADLVIAVRRMLREFLG
jgi:hypothetical protein